MMVFVSCMLEKQLSHLFQLLSASEISEDFPKVFMNLDQL